MKKISIVFLMFITFQSFAQVTFPVFSKGNDIYKNKSTYSGMSWALPIPIPFYVGEINDELTRVWGVFIMPNFYSTNGIAFKNKSLTISEQNNDLLIGSDVSGKYSSSVLITKTSGISLGIYSGTIFERSGSTKSLSYEMNIPRQGVLIYGSYDHIWDAETAMGYKVKGKIFNKTKFDKESIKDYVNRNQFDINLEMGYKFAWLRAVYSPNIFKTDAIPALEKTRISLGINLLYFL